MSILGFQERKRLVGALLACTCLRTLASRELVLDDLPPEVRSRIQRFPDDQRDVDSIVRTCCTFGGALATLLEIVQYQEGNSLSAQELQQVYDDIQARLAGVQPVETAPEEAESDPPEALITPPKKLPASNLFLPYLCNRSTQEGELKTALQARRANRPVLCVIHGHEYECHDKFIERLRLELLPGLLQQQSPVEESLWTNPPAPSAAPRDFWRSLGELLLGPSLKPDESFRALVAQKLTASESPLFVNVGWLTENCEPCRADLFASFLRFWEEWPDLPANRLVICGLSLTYLQAKEATGKFNFWQKSPNEQLRGVVNQLKAKTSDKVTLAVLTELHAITRKEAEDWPGHAKVRPYQIPKEKITKLYRELENRPIAMEVLAPKLQALLSEEPPPRN